MAKMALEGVRVVEFGQLIAIPFATKLLADMGAEVVRIESCTRLDGYRVSGFYRNDASGEFWNRAVNFYEQNRNKKSLTLDLAQERAREILRDLIAVSDVFAENFTPRVIRNFGLEYEDLRRIRPDIIMVSSTGYGHTGPWSGFGAIGYGTEAASGLASVTGYRDGSPTIPELPYADYTAGEHTVFAIMAALAHRAMTGRGQFIDISQTQTLSATVPEPLMDFTFNGRVQGMAGNRDDICAPQGTYPCAREDNWISISVRSDEEWDTLCETLNRSEWRGGSDPRFASGAARADNHDALDEMLAQATSSWDARRLEAALQARGIPAGAVLDGKALLFDDHLNQRGFFEVVKHPAGTNIPPLPYASRPWKFDKTPGSIRRSAPTLGEHNSEVLQDILGMSESETEAMEQAGIIGTAPVRPRATVPPSNELLLEQGRIVRSEFDFEEKVRERFGISQ